MGSWQHIPCAFVIKSKNLDMEFFFKKKILADGSKFVPIEIKKKKYRHPVTSGLQKSKRSITRVGRRSNQGQLPPLPPSLSLNKLRKEKEEKKERKRKRKEGDKKGLAKGKRSVEE
jgi:hypothetical protein